MLKEWKNVYSNLELNQITYNKVFWTNTKPFHNDKSIQSSAITLVNKENNQIISDDLELAQTFNNYSESVVVNLGIKKHESSVNTLPIT